MKRRLPILCLAAMAIIGASYVLRSPSSGVTGSPARTPVALEQAATIGRRELARLIAATERDTATDPTAAGLKLLAQMYLQRARLSGDVATYAQAQEAITQALALAPGDREAAALQASASATTHDFAGAARQAADLVASDPADLGAAATLGDAQVELGQYRDAAQTYAKLAGVAPDAAAVTVRQARVRFLTGDVGAARLLAKRAKEQAVSSAFGDAGLAFYSTFQAQVEHDSGNYDRAAAFYRQALREAPDYYVALAGLARAQAAEGHLADAVDTYEKAVAIVPQPDAVGALGDLYSVLGDAARAKVEYDTVRVIGELAAINKQVYNRAVAVFDADHGIDLDDAVRMTRAELEVRHDVYGYDAAAWALYKTGDLTAADADATMAIAEGTPDARLYYHAGMIADGLGDSARAALHLRRALAISPNFDLLQAPLARRTLAAIEQTLAKVGS